MTDHDERPFRVRNRYGLFAQVPEALVLDKTVSDRAIRVYALLWTYSGKKSRKSWPSRQSMADTLGVAKRTIDRGIRELEERGAIAVESNFAGDRQTNNIYTILVLPEAAPKSRQVIHRGDKNVTPPLSTGVTNMTTPGATNMALQEQEPHEPEIYSPVPEVTDDTFAVANGTGQSNHPATPKTVSATHGKPLSPKDVFASVGRQLPLTFDDEALEQLGSEILAKASARVLDPTAYVIATIRSWYRPNFTGGDLVDRGTWLVRVDEIARDREFARMTGTPAGGMF